MSPEEPLTEDELDWLGEVLLNRIDEDADTAGLDEGILDVSELDGFLTAIVSGPVALPPSRWLPAIWGDFELIWNSAGELQTFMSLLMQHSNSIASTLMEDPEAFEPIYLEHRSEDRTFIIVGEWCEGYLRGVRLAEREWRKGGQEVEELLAPIRAFTEETHWSAQDLESEDELERLRASIEPNVRAIHRKWLDERSDRREPVRRYAPRIGRNDPCPCGSGKKYKRCCLQ